MHAYLWCFSVLFKIVRPISGESSTKLPIWGHHTQKHRFYGIKRWNTMRKKNLFLEPPIPPWSRWPSDSGKLRGSKNKWIFNFTIVTIFWPKKPLGGDPYLKTVFFKKNIILFLLYILQQCICTCSFTAPPIHHPLANPRQPLQSPRFHNMHHRRRQQTFGTIFSSV